MLETLLRISSRKHFQSSTHLIHPPKLSRSQSRSSKALHQSYVERRKAEIIASENLEMAKRILSPKNEQNHAKD
jgi:hypothetical protein